MKTDLLSYLYIAASLAISFTLSGCGDKHEPDIPVSEGLRTVLVYQVANNNLGSAGYDRMDMSEMKKAALAGDIPEDCNLLVYNSGYKSDPHLLRFSADGIDTLKTYNCTAYSVESARMLEVFKDARTLVPSTREFGLVLWSHGSGWLQDGIDDPLDNIQPLSFGSETGHTMNITTLANVLSRGPKLSFLYFDCCYMSSVETLYELRNAAPVIVGSCTELLVYGMPYDQNVRHFFAKTPEMKEAAENTFNLYDSQTGSDRTCTISVIDTSKLDALAKATEAIYSAANGTLPPSFTPQRFMNRGISDCLYFDFGHYVEALCIDADGNERFSGSKALLEDFHQALDSAVTYAAATPKLWNTVNLTHHCGLSTYILKSEKDNTTTNYNTLSWYSDIASRLKFE